MKIMLPSDLHELRTMYNSERLNNVSSLSASLTVGISNQLCFNDFGWRPVLDWVLGNMFNCAKFPALHLSLSIHPSRVKVASSFSPLIKTVCRILEYSSSISFGHLVHG